MSERAVRALEVYGSHRWNATAQKCACGDFFPATLQGNADHKLHRMEKVLEAVDAMPTFCDQCAGPYTEMPWLMEQYGGHWDTCPNRAKAILPEGNFEE